MENATQYGDARECLQAARLSMRQVKTLLSKPSLETADESAALLRDVEVQLGCVAAILRQDGAKPDPGIRAGVEELQSEVALLASFFAAPTRCFPAGWMPFDPVGADTRTAARLLP